MPRSPHERRPEPVRAEEGARPIDVSRLSTPELVARIAQDAQNLVKAEIQLAKTELREDVNGALAAVKRISAAAGFAVAAAVMVLVTIVLALSEVMPAWASALIVAVLLLACAGLAAAMAARAKPGAPLERTRKNLKEDLHWAREKTA